jgi:hypothetical protein
MMNQILSNHGLEYRAEAASMDPIRTSHVAIVILAWYQNVELDEQETDRPDFESQRVRSMGVLVLVKDAENVALSPRSQGRRRDTHQNYLVSISPSTGTSKHFEIENWSKGKKNVYELEGQLWIVETRRGTTRD